MGYATDDAEMSSAREILYLCRGKHLGEVRQEKSCGQPDARRLADLERMLDQLRDDIRAVQAGDRAVLTRARVLYARFVGVWCAPAPHRPVASSLRDACHTPASRCAILASTVQQHRIIRALRRGPLATSPPQILDACSDVEPKWRIVRDRSRCDRAYAEHRSSDGSGPPAYLAGRPISDVAADLRAGILSPDHLPIQAFYYGDDGSLVSANTRSLSALSEAGMQPTNVSIINPSRSLLRRLREEPIISHAPLPGPRVPVTPSQQNLQVLRVIQIPGIE